MLKRRIRKILRFLNYYKYVLLGIFKNYPVFYKREKPVYINFVCHIEHISDSKIYRSFLKFLIKFYQYTSVKLTCCITTPFCSQTKKEMEELGVNEEEYIIRVKELSKYAEIGYHGHFFTITEDKNEAKDAYKNLFRREVPVTNYEIKTGNEGGLKKYLIPISHNNYDLEIIKFQMKKEISWLSNIGIEPSVYVAGWWFMTKDIALLLQEYNFKIDCSIRKFHYNTFGKKYLDDHLIPERGKAFILPPTDKIIEIQSVFYPIEHPYKTSQYLSNILVCSPKEPLFIVFPSHEDEFIEFQREIWANIHILHKTESIEWIELSKMWTIIENTYKLK